MPKDTNLQKSSAKKQQVIKNDSNDSSVKIDSSREHLISRELGSLSLESSKQKTSLLKSSFLEAGWLVLVSLIALIPRLAFLFKSNFGIESDEAIVGLMAKHILEGRDIPIFYYGQNYLGSLEALLVSLAFSLNGISNISLKLVPLISSLLFVVLCYFLTKQYTNKYGARVASLLAALAPNFFIVWGLKARGGFIELLIIGSLSLLIGTSFLRKPSSLKIIGLGLTLGFGWWVNNQIVFYLTALLLVLFSTISLRQGLLASIGGVFLCGLFFLIGGAPFWKANLEDEVPFSSFNTLFAEDNVSRSADDDAGGLGAISENVSTFYEEVFLKHFEGFTTESLPILLGARKNWSTEDFYTGATTFCFILYGAALFLYFTKMLEARFLSEEETKEKEKFEVPYSLPLVFLACLALIFSFSKFGWLSISPRYLLPIYSVLFLVVGVAASKVRDIGGTLFSVSFVALFLVFNFASNYFHSSLKPDGKKKLEFKLALPGEPVVFEDQRVSSSHEQLYIWLQKEGYKHIITNYWIGYRVAFETQEAVTFSHFDHTGPVRIAEYERGKGLREEDVYVLVPKQAEKVKIELAARGFSYRETEVGEYVILDWLNSQTVRGRPIKLLSHQLESTGNSSELSKLVDGDPGTRWKFGGPQKPGMEVLVNFDYPVEISGLDIDLGFWSHDVATELQVDFQDMQGVWCNKFNSSGMDIFFEAKRVWEFYFEPQYVKRIRLRQMGSHPIKDWSIAELIPYGVERQNKYTSYSSSAAAKTSELTKKTILEE